MHLTAGEAAAATGGWATERAASGGSLRISVIGCGYLGAVHAACLATLGHEVVGVDVDPRRVDVLSTGRAPFHEPGFDEVLDIAARSGRLKWTTDISDAASCSVHFICVGTPQLDEFGAADTRFVDQAFDGLLPHLSPGVLVVGKSTVPVGTAATLRDRLREAAPGVVLAWNPEFLREGAAVEDTLHPDRLVYGLPDEPAAAEIAQRVLDAVYAELLAQGVPRLLVNLPTAELVKVASNAFLATKISFVNAMAALCEAAGADVLDLAGAMSRDPRIGPGALGPGLGFGGGCLPKDSRGLAHRAGELGVGGSFAFLAEVDRINAERRAHVVGLVETACGGVLAGRRVAALGAAFKPGTDDVRDSPALAVAQALHARGALVTVTDPQALSSAARHHPDLCFSGDVMAACRDADAVVLLTDWPQYRKLRPQALAEMVRARNVVDARHGLDPLAWRAAGWTYVAPGRPHA